jgi:hypothetical protein
MADELRFIKTPSGFTLTRLRQGDAVALFELSFAEILCIPKLAHPAIRQTLSETVSLEAKALGFSSTQVVAALDLRAGRSGQGPEVLLLLRDLTDFEGGWCMSPTQARELARELTESADAAEASPKPPTRQ